MNADRFREATPAGSPTVRRSGTAPTPSLGLQASVRRAGPAHPVSARGGVGRGGARGDRSAVHVQRCTRQPVTADSHAVTPCDAASRHGRQKATLTR